MRERTPLHAQAPSQPQPTAKPHNIPWHSPRMSAGRPRSFLRGRGPGGHCNIPGPRSLVSPTAQARGTRQ
eukprot:842470-Alexandrium_andersonii.AAC.1